MENNYKILFRPHPLEKNDKYKYLKNDHFEIDNSLTIQEFLQKIDILLNHISSSSYDAIINNTPVVNIENFFEKFKNFQELYQFPPAKEGLKIHKLEEIKSIFDDKEKLKNLLKENEIIKSKINEKIFNRNLDPLIILENIFSKEKKCSKKFENFIYYPIFIVKQLTTNIKKNRYGFYNYLNLNDNILIKKMME